ncbi:MAG: elongation factor 1-beta [Nanoarchaeota archaeon]|nr:elongation factor 1-beta [Nanoarchaeota archaeon]MBU1135199.1 elongation factor 1-beta [Nanoarchaeota archaeon]MBU2519772.1 elongation factor 1-beta [Nanoarchaeota archaeon]
MGEVILVFKIMPDALDSFDKVKSALEELKPERLEEEPVAFGLKALKATFIVPDEGGYMDELEKKLESIEGVQSVENIMTSRSL